MLVYQRVHVVLKAGNEDPLTLPSCFPASSMATLNPLAHARASQIVLQLAGAPQLGAWEERERVPKSQPDKP